MYLPEWVTSYLGSCHRAVRVHHFHKYESYTHALPPDLSHPIVLKWNVLAFFLSVARNLDLPCCWLPFTWIQQPRSPIFPMASLYSNGEWDSDISSVTMTRHQTVRHPEGFCESVSHASIAVDIYSILCVLQRSQERSIRCWLREAINTKLQIGEVARAELLL